MVDREKVIKGLECLSSEEVWPPENTVAYFEKTGERLKEIYTQYHDNPLCRELLLAVYNYLGKAVKEQEN